jgi:hypothetical protein
MCAVVKKGLKLLHAAWDAERSDQQQTPKLYQNAEWESIRERLLEGLRAVHLVCSAGFVKDAAEFAEGMDTMQEACAVCPVRSLLQPSSACMVQGSM